MSYKYVWQLAFNYCTSYSNFQQHYLGVDLVTNIAKYIINKQKGSDKESTDISNYEEIAGGTGN